VGAALAASVERVQASAMAPAPIGTLIQKIQRQSR